MERVLKELAGGGVNRGSVFRSFEDVTESGQNDVILWGAGITFDSDALLIFKSEEPDCVSTNTSMSWFPAPVNERVTGPSLDGL